MIINIDKNYRIESDSQNWILRSRLKNPQVDKKTGKVYEWKDIGFFNSLESLVRYLANLKIRLIPGSDINKILNQIEKISIDLKKTLRPYKIDIV